jgi:hypothetical protein
MTINLPACLDQGLVDLNNYEASHTAITVRQVRSLLEGVTMPCGFPGCSYCDPDYDWYDYHVTDD